MAYIGKKPEDLIRGNATYNAFTGDGSTTTFDVTNLLPDGGAFDVEVFVDNVRQEAGSSKSYTIGQDGSGDLKRVTFIFLVIFIIVILYSTRVIYLSSKTIQNHSYKTNKISRADITDRDGDFISKSVFTSNLGIDPKLVKDKKKLLL